MIGRLLNRMTASIVVTAAIVLAVSGCGDESGSGQSPDLNKRGDGVNAIMQGLHSSDAQKLADVAGPGSVDPADATPLLDKWGGVSDRDYSVSYESILDLAHVMATVSTADEAGKPVQVEFQLNWHDGRWLLGGIGHAPVPTRRSHPAQPGGG